MIINIQEFTTEDNELLQKSYKIRDAVFVQEQNVDKFIEYDGLDDQSTHYLVSFDNVPAGTARWRETEKGIKLERFAVLKEFRGRALASLLLKMILSEVKPSKKLIYLHAQTSALTFYEIHGFIKQGEPFYEAEIEHYTMILP